MMIFATLRRRVAAAPLYSFVPAAAAVCGAAVFLLASAVHAVRPIFEYRALRVGPIIFPADIPFLFGVVAALVFYEFLTRFIRSSARAYLLKRLFGFLVFAGAFKYLFIGPLAFPRLEQLLPLRASKGACEVYSRLTVEEVADQLEVCSAFVGHFSAHFLPLPSSIKIRILFFEDEQQYRQAAQRLQAPQNSLGMFVSGLDAVLTHRGTGLGTLTHEMTHAFLYFLNTPLPAWAHEGVPVFFEKFLALREDGELKFRFGFINPWRFAELRSDLLTVAPFDILERRVGPISESRDGLIAYFLWHNQALPEFLQSLKSGGSVQEQIARLFASSGELNNRWDEFRTYLETNSARWLNTPPSSIFSNREVWDSESAKCSLTQRP